MVARKSENAHKSQSGDEAIRVHNTQTPGDTIPFRVYAYNGKGSTIVRRLISYQYELESIVLLSQNIDIFLSLSPSPLTGWSRKK